MEKRELDIISNLVKERLVSNWNRCEQLGSGTEYDCLTDECTILHGIIRKLNLDMPIYIMASF